MKTRVFGIFITLLTVVSSTHAASPSATLIRSTFDGNTIPASHQIPTTKYVQNFFRGHCENPNLTFDNISNKKLPSEKYVLSAIDMINTDTTFAANAHKTNLASMLYLKSSVDKIKASENCCHIPWDITPEKTTYIDIQPRWDTANINFVPKSWHPIIYGKDKFVAITYSDTGAYSYDGLTWIPNPMPQNQDWDSVMYGNGIFVSVARRSNIMAYSYDGINWNTSTMPFSNVYWQPGTWGKDKFVVLGFNTNNGAYSYDGKNWYPTDTLPTTNGWHSVTYGNGVFVAVAGNYHGTTDAIYSYDGITWHKTAPLPVTNDWQSVVYGNGKFILVGKSARGGATTTAAISDNGINWYPLTLPASKQWLSITYGNGVFLAVSYGTNFAMYSFDSGETWYETNIPLDTGWQYATYGNNRFITASPSNNNIAIFHNPAIKLWAVGRGCNADATTVETMCETVLVGGTATCSNAKCSCTRTHLIGNNDELAPNAGPTVSVNRTFVDNDACNASCADICADNVVNNTDGAQKAILCGK